MGLFKSKEERIKEYNIKMQREIERINALGIFPTKTLQLQYSAFPIIYIDDNNKKLLVINYPGDEYVLNYNDIIDFELKIDDVSTFRYSLKTALIGQFDSKKKINNIQVNLYVNSIDNSFIEIRIFPRVGTAVTWYEGENLANQLIGVLNYIKNNKELKPSKNSKNTNNNLINNTTDDSEIRNLKKQIEEQKEEIKKQQIIIEENAKLNKENQLLKQQIEKSKNIENDKQERKNNVVIKSWEELTKEEKRRILLYREKNNELKIGDRASIKTLVILMWVCLGLTFFLIFPIIPFIIFAIMVYTSNTKVIPKQDKEWYEKNKERVYKEKYLPL